MIKLIIRLINRVIDFFLCRDSGKEADETRTQRILVRGMEKVQEEMQEKLARPLSKDERNKIIWDFDRSVFDMRNYLSKHNLKKTENIMLLRVADIADSLGFSNELSLTLKLLVSCVHKNEKWPHVQVLENELIST